MILRWVFANLKIKRPVNFPFRIIVERLGSQSQLLTGNWIIESYSQRNDAVTEITRTSGRNIYAHFQAVPWSNSCRICKE